MHGVESFIKTSVTGEFVYRRGKLRSFSIKRSRTDSRVEVWKFSDVSATSWICGLSYSLKRRGTSVLRRSCLFENVLLNLKDWRRIRFYLRKNLRNLLYSLIQNVWHCRRWRTGTTAAPLWRERQVLIFKIFSAYWKYLFPPMPPHVHINFVVPTPGCCHSVTDFWGWGFHRARLRCPSDVSDDYMCEHGVPGGALHLRRLIEKFQDWFFKIQNQMTLQALQFFVFQSIVLHIEYIFCSVL
jgi:hypothetical protein